MGILALSTLSLSVILMFLGVTTWFIQVPLFLIFLAAFGDG